MRYKVWSSCTGRSYYEGDNYTVACMMADFYRRLYGDDQIGVVDAETNRFMSEVYDV